MSNIYILFLLFPIIINQIACNGNIENRIFGGYDCNMTAHPFIVEIFTRLLCGGALLTAEWVLTAAHCLEEAYIIYYDTLVKAGFNCPPQYSQYRDLKHVIQHPKYKDKKLHSEAEIRYDIGLVLVQEPFYYSDFVKPCKLPLRGSRETCKVATAAGIGKTLPSEDISSMKDVKKRPLKCVEMTAVDLKVCSETYKKVILDDSIICMLDEGKDTCQGDSGGPLFCNDTLLIGIVSFGPVECGSGMGAGSYTKVASYLDFIYKHIGNLSNSSSFSQPRSSKDYKVNKEYQSKRNFIFNQNYVSRKTIRRRRG